MTDSDAVCLVVTRLKNYRDTSDRLAFVSNSVPDYLEKKWLQTIDHIILDGPWKTLEYQDKALQHNIDRVLRYRNELSKTLNRLIDLDYSKRAWGFLLDSWLLVFISLIYDRVNKLENARQQLGGDVYLYENIVEIPIFATTMDFLDYCTQDGFNQQLYSEVAKVLGIKIKSCKKKFQKDSPITDKIPKCSWKGRMLISLIPILRSIFRILVRYANSLVILDGYFPCKESFWITIRSLGRVLLLPWPLLLQEMPLSRDIDSKRMLLKVVEVDKYDKVANHLLSRYLPQSFFENLKLYRDNISGLKNIPVLGSAVNFYWNDAYKNLASLIIDNGGKILGFQHGGISNKTFPNNTEEIGVINFDDFYYWKKKSISGLDLPTTKLRKIHCYREKRDRLINHTDVLFVSTNPGIYLYRHSVDHVDIFLGMIHNQFEFYKGLNRSVKEKFLLRAYPDDRGWRYKERWMDFAGGHLRFDSNKKIFESLTSSRLYVSDHMSTTWMEAFYIGIPVLLFLDIDRHRVPLELRGVFEDLRSVGVLHSTPELASAFLNERYDSIEEWWKMPETLLAVDNFKNNFFCDQDDFVKPWTDELLAIRREVLHGK